MPAYHITPNDVLFFRDARPFETGGGHGARWPDPGVIFSALHAACHRAWPDTPAEWEHLHRHGVSNRYDNQRRDKRFGSLQTCGPFPCCGSKWYFPAPRDGVAMENNHVLLLKPVCDGKGKSNLPSPLQYALGSTSLPDKGNIPPAWWSKADIEAYLAGGTELKDTRTDDRIFESEWITGIGIDPETQAQDGEHIYSAEYMRLQKNISMGIVANMPLKGATGEGLSRLFESNGLIIVGGQQRVCRVESTGLSDLDGLLPVGRPVTGTRVKWLLLTPSVFPKIGEHPGGWLPTWVDHQTGAVKLTDGPGKNKAGRKKLTPGNSLDVRLVAARIPKPMVINGWSERLHIHPGGRDKDGKPVHGATATELAAPAGTVYYFEGPDAARLAAQLNWHGDKEKNVSEILKHRSSKYGEQGFGIGVCGSWDI